MEETFEENLPNVNPNENLESKSNKQFQLLFTEEKFEIRPENLRDKGIDFFIEIKKSQRYTGFRFAVQLKATNAPSINSDGSISFSFETKNINYIINSAIPGYYFLYVSTTNTFYYDSVSLFAKSLYEKDEAWEKQQTHTLRFEKKVDENAINEIFVKTQDWYKSVKKINEKTIIQQISLNSGDKIIVDENFNITDDAQIRKLIEALGMNLINEGKWKDILVVHNKATGNVATTGRYNLVLGLANYYSGNLFESLSYFKKAIQLKSDLPTSLLHHLEYFDATVKFSIGIISMEKYDAIMSELDEKDNIGLYIKIEKAKRNYLNSTNQNIEERYSNYQQEIREILDNPNADSGIKFNARCELLLYQGFQSNVQFVQDVARTNAIEGMFGPNPGLRNSTITHFLSSKTEWHKTYSSLKDEALGTKNHFIFFNAIVNYVKVNYEMLVFTDVIFFVMGSQEGKNLIIEDKATFINDLIDKISHAYEYFFGIGHIENTIAALSTKFELLHYSENSVEAQKVLTRLEDLINNYDLPEFKRKLIFLKNKGTTHETFLAWLNNIDDNVKIERAEVADLVSKMKEMDADELLHPEKSNGNWAIQFVPIGVFRFPEAEIENVFSILEITDAEIKERFLNVLKEGATPIANLYNNPITTEGPLGDIVYDSALKCWRNIYRIRRLFFENNYFRIIMASF